jgi:Zn-dependent protease
LSGLLLQFIVTLPVLLLSLVFHEVSHGYIALRLGDETARSRGRLSPNPLKHLDPLGTLVLFMTFFFSNGSMLFGWAKPVPINPAYFKSPQRGMGWVGLAGPSANLILVAASSLLIQLLYSPAALYEAVRTDQLLATSILLVFQLNVILMVFNLFPVPPLDGSRIVGAFLNRRTYAKWIQLDRHGMIFVFILLFVLLNFGNGLYEIISPIYRLFLPSYGF